MGVELIVAVVIGGAVAVSVAKGLVRSLSRGRAYQAQVAARWRALADELGGSLDVEGGGTLSPLMLRLTARVEESTVFAAVTVPTDTESIAHTRVFAPFVLGTGPRFSVREASEARSPHDVRLVSTEPEAARRAWTEEDDLSARSFARPLAVRSDGRRVEVVWSGVEEDEAVIKAALDLVARVAASGVSALRALTTLDGAAYEAPPSEVPALRVRRGSAVVHLTVVGDGGPPSFIARANMSKALPVFSARVLADGSLEGDVPPGLIDPEAGSLARLAGSTLRADEDALVIVFDGVPDETRAEAAVRLLAAVAGGSGEGAFR